MTNIQYYSLLTSSGHQTNMKTKALGLPILISRVALGNGNITPTESVAASVKEEIKISINSIIQNETDKNTLEIEAVIPSNVGGFLVGEAVLYLENGTLYVVVNPPASYKSSLDQGAGKEFAFTVFLISIGVENVTLRADDSIILVTRKYVQSEFKKYASRNEDKTQAFRVKDAVKDDGAVGKEQLDEIAEKVDNAILNTQFLPIDIVFGGYEDDNPDFIVAFGGTFKKADYPKLWEYVSTRPNRLKTLAQWSADLTANDGICDYYCEVDGLNFRASSSDGAFVRFSSRVVGSYKKDILASHNHKLASRVDSQTGGQWYLPPGVGGLAGGATDLISYEGGVGTRPKNIAQKPLVVAK